MRKNDKMIWGIVEVTGGEDVIISGCDNHPDSISGILYH